MTLKWPYDRTHISNFYGYAIPSFKGSKGLSLIIPLVVELIIRQGSFYVFSEDK